MKIQILTLGTLNTNCYLMSDNLTHECLIIDPADEPDLIAEEILRQQLTPVAILATHGHYDHIMAASALQLNFDLPFMIHQDDEFLVTSLAQRASHWEQRTIELDSPKITQFLQAGQLINCGNIKLEVMNTSGHTPGCVCFISREEKLVFTGDTLFADGVGRTDFSYSLATKMEQSLKKIKQELANYQAYPGHGEEFIIE